MSYPIDTLLFFQDGMLVENMHDLPWLTSDKLGPETTACMAAICKEIRRECPSMPIGIQVLTAGNKEALAIAKATGRPGTCLSQSLNVVWLPCQNWTGRS